jgi:hypothetical protein
VLSFPYLGGRYWFLNDGAVKFDNCVATNKDVPRSIVLLKALEKVSDFAFAGLLHNGGGYKVVVSRGGEG